MGVSAAGEKLCKEEERNAERERRRRERKDREHGEKTGGEGNCEMRLLKLVGAVAVRTMSRYRTRIEVDKFRKRCVVFPSPLDCFR